MEKFKENPWKTVGSVPIYENPWIKVREDKVINPSGGTGIYGVVSFKNLAIGIIPLDENNNTWIVGQHRYSLNEYSWEIPMGGCPEGVTPLQAAKNELLEETGLKAKLWEHIMKVHTSNSVTNEVGHVYIARDLEYFEPNFDETEQLEIRKLPFQEVLSMVMNQEITDCISVAGILKAQLLLKL